jgi:hypothetical protein
MRGIDDGRDERHQQLDQGYLQASSLFVELHVLLGTKRAKAFTPWL